MAGLATPIFSQDVNSSGAFTYSYPIDIPAGTNGMAPALSLNYNSQGGNGMLGMGWSLSGLQTITRDSSYPINWDDSDHFLLNGQRLIPDGSVYRTENESFIKIEYVNTSYWVVTQKNGTKLFFGKTDDSKIEGVGKGAARVWALNKVLDVHGNFYTITYKEDDINGDYYPAKIEYTMSEATDQKLSKFREVIFSYETRDDHYAKYNPSKIDLDKRLKWITVNIGGNVLRKYRLDYVASGSSIDRSRLMAIQEYGSGGIDPSSFGFPISNYSPTGSVLPEVRFDWGDDFIGLKKSEKESYLTGIDLLYAVSTDNLQRYLNIFSADINGDGLKDIVNVDVENGLWRILFSNGEGFDPCYTESNLTGYYDLNHISNENLQRFLNIIPADVNGDGLTDIITVDTVSGLWRILFSNGSGFDPFITESNLTGYYDLNHISNENLKKYLNFFAADFSGNGLTDILTVDVAYGELRTIRNVNNIYSNYLSSITLPSGATITPTYTPATQVDGAIDPTESSYPNISNKSPRSLVTSLEVSDGMDESYTTTYSYYNGKTYKGYRDETKSLGFQWTQKNNPDGSFSRIYRYQEKEALLYAGAVKRVENFGSDGLLYSAMENVFLVKQLEAASNGYHAINTIKRTDSYSYNFNGVDYSGKYDSDWDTLINSADIDMIKTHTNYKYDTDGNVVRVYNHGDVQVKADDSVTVTEFYTNSDNFITAPKFVKSYSFGKDEVNFNSLETDTNLASHQKFFYDGDSVNGIGAKGELTKTLVYSGEKDQSKYPNLVTEYTYDLYGNIKTVKDAKGIISSVVYDTDYYTYVKYTQVKDGDDVLQESGEIVYDNYMRPVKAYDMNGNFTTFTYDSFGRQTAVYDGEITTTNPALSRITYSDTPAETGSPAWVKNETYLPENPDDYLESYSFYNGLGQILQVKSEGYDDETNTLRWVTVDYHYDFDNKQTRITEPYYSEEEYDSKKGPEFNHLEEMDVPRSGSVSTMDSVGRISKVQEIKVDNNLPVITQYFQYGLKSRTTLIDNGLGDGQNQIVYDEIDGIDQISYTYNKGYYSLDEVSGTISNFNNSGWVYKGTSTATRNGVVLNEVSKDDDELDRSGNSITTLVDSLGRKKSYTDPDMGTWTYEYDINSNLVKQTDAKGNDVTFEYDKLQRIIFKGGANDVYYCYDGNKYDSTTKIDNVLQKHGPSAKGQLTSIYYNSPTDDSYIEDYYYDDENSLYKITKTIDGISRTFSVTLDEIGRITEEHFPQTTDEDYDSYNYNATGNIESLYSYNNERGINHISNLRYNILGKITGFTQGNGINTVYTYNENHRLSNILISKGTNITIGNLDFEYDSYGNIKSKEFYDKLADSEVVTRYSEMYEYDDLFRLVKAECKELYGTKTYKYDSYNNMVENNVLTDNSNNHRKKFYNYDKSIREDGGAHSVREIKNRYGQTEKTYEYDKNGNVVTIGGQSHIIIHAKGEGVEWNPPRMELWINGQNADTPEMTWTVTNTEYRTFTWHGYIPPSSETTSIDIIFANDNVDGMKHTSLFVDFIVVNGVQISPGGSNATVEIVRGAYTSRYYDSPSIISGQEKIADTGALRFTNLPAEAFASERKLVYDKENRLTEIKDKRINHNWVTTARFGYNPSGQRIGKIKKDIKTYYFFEKYEEEYDISGTGEVLEQSIKYYFANGQRVAKQSSRDGLAYYHADHLGSAVRLTDKDGNVIQSIAYTPFGKVAWAAGRDTTNYTYTDQEADINGFMYYNARYYDPDLGRFLQADTFLDGMNRYTYCGNNPVMYSDPSGHCSSTLNNNGFGTTKRDCGKSDCSASSAYTGGSDDDSGDDEFTMTRDEWDDYWKDAIALYEDNKPDDSGSGSSGGSSSGGGGSGGSGNNRGNSNKDGNDSDKDGRDKDGGSEVLANTGNFLKGVGKQYVDTMVSATTGCLNAAARMFVPALLIKDGYDLYQDYANSGASNPFDYVGQKLSDSWNGLLSYIDSNPWEAAGRGFFIALTMVVGGKVAKIPGGGGKLPVGENITYLYQKVGANGQHLKYGITKNPLTRYTKAQLNGGRLRLLAGGTKSKMLSLERILHKTLPIGIQEGQAFYINIQKSLGFKIPPY